MKLVAMWVEDFMKIKNSGFNFGSKLIFNFNFDEKKRNLIISAEPTADYFDLFSGSGIVNVTGIIGTNGSGKTTLLKILNTLYAQKPLENSIIAIFENEETSIYEIYDYKTINNFFGNKNGIQISLQEKGLFSGEMQKSGQIEIKTNKAPFENIDLIFYSNLYSDQNDNYLLTDNHLNRSVDYQTIKSLTPHKLREYLRVFNLKKERRTFFIEESYNPLSIYHYDKLRRLVTFLADVDPELAMFFHDDIPFPDAITIWPNESIPENTFKVFGKYEVDFRKIEPLYEFCVTNNYVAENPKQQLKNAIIYSLFFFAFYNDFFKKSERNGTLEDIKKFLDELPLDNFVYENINKFMQSQESSRKNSEINTVKNNLSRLDSLLENIVVTESTGAFGKGGYDLAINKSLWRFLSSLLSITDHNDEAVIMYTLNPFSAGEGAILGQFSEFFQAIKHINKKNVLVTIDEGELYMHPEWQRKYINALFNFFSYFATEKNINFQIIVTSHSPFLVSDIPKYNLIYLDKNKNGTTRVLASADQKPTMGGNIFELFQNGFYMKEFIGEFAFNMINEAINFLNDKESIFHNLIDVESFTKLIGEDIIRGELQRVIDMKKIKDFDKYFEIVTDDHIKVTDLKENKKDDKKKKND